MTSLGAKLRKIAREDRVALPPPRGGENEDRGPGWPRWASIAAALLAAALLIGVLAYLLTRSGGSQGQPEQPPAVTATEAKRMTWRDELTAIGTFEAIQGVEVTTELAGTVTDIAFANGARVEAGTPLVALDTSTEEAQANALEAQAVRARLAYERQERLIARGATSEAEVEDARAAWRNLSSQVDETRARIEKKRIEAPFTGTLGIRRVSLGEFVGPGTPIVTLQTIDPIYVNFDLPERALDRLAEGQRVDVRTDVFGDRLFEGTITALSPEIAAGTRSVRAQATLPNEDAVLRPGMFADVTVRLPGERDVVAVPTTAITRNAYGTSAFLVGPPDPDRTRERAPGGEDDGFLSGLFGGAEETEKSPPPDLVARTVFVRTGEQRDLLIEVLEGIEAGDRVVTAGQLKLDDGSAVRVSERDVGRGVDARPEAP